MTRSLSFVAARRAIGLLCGGCDGKSSKFDAWTTLEAITVLRGAPFAGVQCKVTRLRGQSRGITADVKATLNDSETPLKDFQRFSDLSLASVMARLDDVHGDTEGNTAPYADITQGKMIIHAGKDTTLNVVKHADSQELELDSPVSGTSRYCFSNGKWVPRGTSGDMDDAPTLERQLSSDIKQLAGMDIEFEPPLEVTESWLGYGPDPT